MTSASGTFSGVRQGMLVGEGTFTLQFIRLPGDSIRVRVFSGARRKGSAGGTLSGAMAASYVFLPSSILGRAKEIRKRVERWADRIGPKKTLSERIEAYSSRARVPLGLLLDHAGLGESDGWSWLEESWEGAEDAAVGWATSGMMSLDTLEWTVRSSVEHMLDQLTMGWKDKIEPQLDTIQRWSNRSVNLSGAVSLSTSFERDVRTVCDYTFDLNDEHARVALERAISGRTVLLGAFQGLAGSNVTDALFADFTLADSLAQEDIGAGDPRVERGARGFSDLRKQQESVRLSGFWLSNGWEIQSDQNRFLLEKPEGETEEWTGYGWDWKHQTNWWGDSKVESLGSGAFVEDSGGQSPAGYWVTWDKTFPTSAAFPVHEALSESLNLTGPVGLLAGLPTLYHGEYAGRVSVQLELFFSKEVLEALMDPHRTPDSLIWAEWARVAQGFDNTFGLPYLPFGVIPPYLGEIPGAVESCATVQAAWGAHYCAFIADTFLPALRMAQDSGSPTDSLDFLHSIYTRKVGPGNPIGARILSRFIANLAYSQGKKNTWGFGWSSAIRRMRARWPPLNF